MLRDTHSKPALPTLYALLGQDTSLTQCISLLVMDTGIFDA